MPIFIAGLLLGGISAGGTFILTSDGNLALVIGGVVALLAWLGFLGIIFIDD